MNRLLISTLACGLLAPALCAEPEPALQQARASAKIASPSLSKVQRWLHQEALPKIDPKTKLYISHPGGSGRYRESWWNYDDTAADTYPFLFWAAWYTDHDQINGPILEVLEAEQRICNHLDRIPTAVNHQTLEKNIKSHDKLVFAASEYVKDGLIAIIEVAGKDNPWFERMRGIEDDIWKHANIDTPYGKIPTLDVEANGEQLQALVRLYTATGEKKYLQWAERIADYYLLPGGFVPKRLRDHGCEIIGGLGLLYAVESVHQPAKAKQYEPHLRHLFDEILKRGVNEHGIMYNQLDQKKGGLSDGWGYNYVGYLCYDMVADQPVYRDRIKGTLRQLAQPQYRDYRWEASIDGNADSTESAIYMVNQFPVPEAIAWIDQQAADHLHAARPEPMWGTMKLQSNAVRTVLQHALMHTRGTIARPWRQDLQLGASQEGKRLTVVIEAEQAWSGTLLIDKPRHRLEMGFTRNWPRMNTMPEWYTVEPDASCTVTDTSSGKSTTHSGAALHQGLALKLKAGEQKVLVIEAK